MKNYLCVLILGMFILPVFPQDGPPPTTGDTSEVSDAIADLMKRAEQGDASAQYLVRWYRGATEEGYRLAQYYLGNMYSKGEGVAQDHKEAARWYRAAAEQGYRLAQYELGNMYYRGQGLSQDYGEALKWYRAAAEKGHSEAQSNLASMYSQGEGVPQDYREAVRWYRAAAEQGYWLAQNNLGGMYHKGQGAPQDYIQAHMWFNLAASNLTGGIREAIAEHRDEIAKKMTAEQIAEAQRLAREWKPKTGSQ